MKVQGFGGYIHYFDSLDSSIAVEFPAGRKRWIHSITAGFGQATAYPAAVLDTALVVVARGSFDDVSKAWNYTQDPPDAVFQNALFIAVWQISTMQHFTFQGRGMELPDSETITVILPNPLDTVNVPPTFDPFVGTLSVIGTDESSKDPFGELR